MRNILVIAPHPDDETLGCGATILRHISEGDRVYWLIITQASKENGFNASVYAKESNQILQVAKNYGFTKYFQLTHPPMKLDQVGKLDLIMEIGDIVNETQAEVIYLPYREDAHSDHMAVFDAAVACTKTFRYPYVKSVLAYETLSETEFGLKPSASPFRPNLYINVSNYLERKISIMKCYDGEMGEFPFPRSEECIRSLAKLRGSQAGFFAAESFVIIKEIK